ncbi:MAG TPA: hypothetical protein VGQ99_05920 [Tepidisphaeraceae bacterium]|jgi:hypothetical protein|nr:hypothetical protein [Tepidisphaeraceae bacterium]
MNSYLNQPHIYDGEGDQLMEGLSQTERIILLPDVLGPKNVDLTPRIRIMWGQWLLKDLLTRRYRTLVCAVNAYDNTHGIIAQVAQMLPTSQWTESAITSHAKHFVQRHSLTVVKYDMDAVEVLALLRPSEHEHLTLKDLSRGFRTVTEMLNGSPHRWPSASVCFLGARANRLIGDDGREPSFETVLRSMYESGYRGDVYPAPSMWESSPTGVFARYPFPDSLDYMRVGGS